MKKTNEQELEVDMKPANKHETIVATGALRVFVYGTLKKGHINHDRFCRAAFCIEEATVRGRLYELPSGIPVLRVPDHDIIAVGTSDPLMDVVTQEHFLGNSTVETACGDTCWQMIHGELVVFSDPQLSLPPMDRLEGFRPGSFSLYRRVLVSVFVAGNAQVPAWCYVAEEGVVQSIVPTGKRCWP